MNFSILFFFRLAIFILPLPTIVDAKLVMTVIVNDGDLPTIEGYDCNEADTQLIATTIGADYDDVGRRLRVYPQRCIADCRGFAVGTCPKPGCKGFRRRNLRKNESAIRLSAIRELDDGDDETGRRLYPIYCRDYCRGYAKGTCRATNCKGYRRRNLKQKTIRELDDGGDAGAICETGIATLNNDLDNLIPQLSEGCRPVVQDKLTLLCFDDVRF